MRIEVPPPGPAASVETELSEDPAAAATTKQPAPRTSTASGATVPTATLATSAADPEQGKGAAAKAGLRKRQVFAYDLDVPSLDPKFTAKERLEQGTTPLVRTSCAANLLCAERHTWRPAARSSL